MLSFVDRKVPDLGRIGTLLEQCRAVNMWANRGPLYHMMAETFAAHMSLDDRRSLVPCANAGVGLEAMARLVAQQTGRKLRWVGSAFSFKNLGRGYFADMSFVDCTEQGLLDLDALKALDPDSWDGFVLVNPFGLSTDLSAYIRFAEKSGKRLLIDNAAGLGPVIPDWPWQAFSLHHTKPYGLGEGGLTLVPGEDRDALYALLNYGDAPSQPSDWMNNGKISDIACAFHLARLEQHQTWAPRYLEQAERVDRLALEAGLQPLLPIHPTTPVMSRAYLCPTSFAASDLSGLRHVVCVKYYDPLVPLPRVNALFDRLVNVPTHPDMAELSDDALSADLAFLAGLDACQKTAAGRP